MQAPIKVKTRIGVVVTQPNGRIVNKRAVINMDGKRIGTVEQLDTGRWIAHPDRIRSYSGIAQAVTVLQRAQQ